MFHHRKNSQKPGSELIARFQQSFGGVIRRRNSDGPQPQHFCSHDDSNLVQVIASKFSPKVNLGDIPGLNFSPLWMDPVSMHRGCYTPRSGGRGAILHNQAGNLHSPSIESIMTPPSCMGSVTKTQLSLDQFNAQYIAPHIIQTDLGPHQSKYASSTSKSHALDYNAVEQMEIDSTLDLFSFDPPPNLIGHPAAPAEVSPQDMISEDLSYSQGKEFRYHVTLIAPTAMVESADKAPISYLNKGQVYDITVMDLRPPVMTPEPLHYRTFIRISFDTEEQRLNPATCWQMWEYGRGMSEAQQRGSELLAIEFIPDGEKHRHLQVEQVSVDGFCVTWVVEPASRSQSCSIPIQFNFLSTDFSHSKGVRGVPVRLCAKTELLSLEDMTNPRGSEVCYCKVKLFRDHGAERKVANDLSHVRKAIEKLEQQIHDAGISGRPGKRRRGNTTSTDMTGSDRGSIQSGTQDGSIEDLQAKLAIAQGMISSARSVSVLALQGDMADDPDQSPIQWARDQTSANHVKVQSSEDQSLEQAKQLIAEGPSKRSACFFIRLTDEVSNIFRAIYLTERTAEELRKKISEKYHLDQSKIVRMLHVIKDNMKIVVDDDMVREIAEGQDMIIDICGSSVAGDDDSFKEIRLKY